MASVSLRPRSADSFVFPVMPVSCDVFEVDDLAPPLFAQHFLYIHVDDPALIDLFQQAHGVTNAPGPGITSQTAILPTTPNIAALASGGLRLLSYRVNPVCSPTRAGVHTGVYSFRHGIGDVVRPDSGADLKEFGDPGFTFGTIFQALDQIGVKTCFVGKIHMATWTTEEFVDPYTGVGTGRFGMGWPILDRVVAPGTVVHTQFRNLNQHPVPGGALSTGSYYSYFKNSTHINENKLAETQYATSWQTDRVIDFFNTIADDDRAFCYMAVNATHSPYGVASDRDREFPPPALVNTQEYIDTMQEVVDESINSTWPVFMAMLEALDREIGRLLASIPPAVRAKLTVFIAGDNGVEPSWFDGRQNPVFVTKDLGPKWNAVTDNNRPQTKGHVYHWGSNTWAIWNGPGRGSPQLLTKGQTSWAMVDHVDMAATILEYFEAPPMPMDGVSALPVIWDGVTRANHARQFSLSEHFWPLGSWTDITVGEDGTADPNEHLHRGFQKWLKGADFPNGIGGRFHLVRRFENSAYIDELYLLNAENETPVDLWEENALDIDDEYRDQYLHMLQALTDLLNSGFGGTVLKVYTKTDLSVFRTIATNPDLSLPVMRLGVPAAAKIVATSVPPIGVPVQRFGTDTVIPYDTSGTSTEWAIEIKRGIFSPNVPHFLLDVNDHLPVMTAQAFQGRYLATTGSNPPKLVIKAFGGDRTVTAIPG